MSKIVPYLLVFILSFMAGWKTNGYRWELVYENHLRDDVEKQALVDKKAIEEIQKYQKEALALDLRIKKMGDDNAKILSNYKRRLASARNNGMCQSTGNLPDQPREGNSKDRTDPTFDGDGSRGCFTVTLMALENTQALERLHADMKLLCKNNIIDCVED